MKDYKTFQLHETYEVKKIIEVPYEKVIVDGIKQYILKDKNSNQTYTFSTVKEMNTFINDEENKYKFVENFNGNIVKETTSLKYQIGDDGKI